METIPLNKKMGKCEKYIFYHPSKRWDEYLEKEILMYILALESVNLDEWKCGYSCTSVFFTHLANR